MSIQALGNILLTDDEIMFRTCRNSTGKNANNLNCLSAHELSSFHRGGKKGKIKYFMGKFHHLTKQKLTQTNPCYTQKHIPAIAQLEKLILKRISRVPLRASRAAHSCGKFGFSHQSSPSRSQGPMFLGPECDHPWFLLCTSIAHLFAETHSLLLL